MEVSKITTHLFTCHHQQVIDGTIEQWQTRYLDVCQIVT